MGALTGTMAPKSYILYGDFDQQRLVDEINHRHFSPLPSDTDQTSSVGWVHLTEHNNTDFTASMLFYTEHLMAFSLREDKLVVPPAQVKFRLDERYRKRLVEEGVDSLSRQVKQEIKDEVIFELRRHVIPTIKLYEVVVDLANKRVWFFGKSKSIVEVFEEMFNESFATILIPDTPFTSARMLIGEKQAESLTDLQVDLLFADEED